MKNSSPLINEEKLYSVIGKFFTDGNNLLLELIQNAQRAKANNVSVDLPYAGEHPFGSTVKVENLLRIADDGNGIRDIIALLGIAISDWSADIAAQDPAGMGFLQLLALSQQVYIQSRFGSLYIDSQRFLKDREYRLHVIDNADKDAAIETGTVITAEMQKAWYSYMRSDYSWYRGHNGLNLKINGNTMEPITIKEMIQDAEEKKNLFRVTRYLGNSLFIEIGNADNLVGSSHSAVNWYGQLIPVYQSTGVAANYQIRYYFEVNNGTPLTPRYPDRTSLNRDDKYKAFTEFVNSTVLAMLRQYFDSFPEGARFSAYANANLLANYYEHADEAELESLEWVPVIDDAFTCGNGLGNTITTKREMLKNNISFHEGGIQVDDELDMGVDWDQVPCYNVSEKVATQLRRYGIPELLSVNTLKAPENLINITELMLEFRYANGSIALIPVRNALLLDAYGDLYIYADSESMVHGIVDDLLEQVYSASSDYSLEDMRDDLANRIDEQLATSFSIIDPRHFDFIPKHHDIEQIRFEHGNLAVSYQDGSKRDFMIRR